VSTRLRSVKQWVEKGEARERAMMQVTCAFLPSFLYRLIVNLKPCASRSAPSQ
jgi:hypothetical protein